MKALVTGGAGFIGSHLAEALIKRGDKVTVLDDLSSGSKRSIASVMDCSDFEFMLGDCRNPTEIRKAMKDTDVVFHFAANPEVRLELSSPKECYERNIKATFTLLEETRKVHLNKLVFASSSTIYGDATQMPTPVDYGPLKPISVYGASKLACEALISSYCGAFGKRSVILRFANVIGPRSLHGVVYDFFKKLHRDPSELLVLGDGKQSKSYLYIDDCIDAILKAYESSDEKTAIFNIGSEDMISVSDIAKIVVKELGLEGRVRLRFSGGVNGGRGWQGDVKTMLLDIKETRTLGWKPKLNSRAAVKKLVQQLKRSYL